MTKTIATLTFALLVSGCATLSKPETFAVCKTADVISTKMALNAGQNHDC